MNRSLFVFAALAFSACDFLPGGGGGVGGGAGGGGTGGGDFSKGYVFVRKDDKNLYVTDTRDLNTVLKVTTEGGSRHPSLSRDGKRIVFSRTTATDTEIDTVSTAGGMVSQVFLASSTLTTRNVRNPVFTPDGARIVFAFDEGAGSSLGIVNSDGTGYAKLIGGVALSYAAPSMASDGASVIAAAGNSGTQLTQIERVSLSTGMATNITNMLGLEVQGIASRVVVSPDGTKAVFDGRLSSGSTRIFVIDLATKAITRITDYPGEPGANDASPCWVGNDKVGFSSDTGGNDQIYALPVTSMMTSGGLQVPGGTEPWYGPN